MDGTWSDQKWTLFRKGWCLVSQPLCSLCFDHFNEVSKLHDQGGLAGKLSGHQHCARPILPWWTRIEFQSIAIWLSKFFLRALMFSSFIKVTPSLLHRLVLLCSWITHGPYGSSLRHLTFAFQPKSCHVVILFIDLFSFVCFVLSMQSREFFFCLFKIYVQISMWRRWHFKRHCCLGNHHMFCIWRAKCTN